MLRPPLTMFCLSVLNCDRSFIKSGHNVLITQQHKIVMGCKLQIHFLWEMPTQFVIVLFGVFLPQILYGQQTINILIDRTGVLDYAIWNQTFVTYLNQEIGNDHHVVFQLISLENRTSWTDMQILQQPVHFRFASAETCVCDSVKFNAAPIVTVNYKWPMYKALSENAGVIVARSDNSNINYIQDLKGAAVCVSNLADMTTALLRYALNQEGIDLYRDAKMISIGSPDNFLSDESVLELVSSGRMDVGFVQASKFASFPHPSLLKVIGTVPSLSLPFPTSTIPSPNGCLSAFPSVAPALKLAVLTALARLNSSHPAAVAGGYSGWEVALDYENARTVLEATGALSLDPVTLAPVCWGDSPGWQYYDAATCPAGYYKVPEEQASQNCREANLSCITPVCWCGVCAPGPAVQVFAAPAGPDAAVGNESSCQRMQPCAASAQRQGFVLTAIDGLRRRNLTVTYSFGPLLPPPAAGLAAGELAPSAGEPWNHSGTVTTSAEGYSVLRVFVDGEELAESPTLLLVLPSSCPNGFASPGFSLSPRRAAVLLAQASLSRKGRPHATESKQALWPLVLSPDSAAAAAAAGLWQTRMACACAPGATWRSRIRACRPSWWLGR